MWDKYEVEMLIEDAVKERTEELEKELASAWGFVRRLEKSNQELGEENQRLKGIGSGWNAPIEKRT